MQNSSEIFTIALGLFSPWYIKEITFIPEKQLDIYIDFEKGYQFTDPDGGTSTAYDSVERSWEHLNFFQHKCYIHARVPRVKYGDNKIATHDVPWARKGSGFTLLFEAYAMLLIEYEMPISKVGKLLQVYSNRIRTIFNYWISIAHNKDEISSLPEIGFDETSIKKGHNYVTTLVDMKERRVLYACEGKGASCIEQSVEYIEEKGIKRESVEQVCIDMSPAFISGCQTHLPQTSITFDKFHVCKEVNKAMDELRKGERLVHAQLAKHKYTFLKNKLSPDRLEERDRLLELYPKLGEGFRLKTMFMDFWDIENTNKAASYLAFWCDQAMDSGIFPFQRVVKTIKKHWTGIINYIKSKITNGILEGINSKIQLAKKRARGFRNTENFINMIYFIAGKLKFDYPLYLT